MQGLDPFRVFDKLSGVLILYWKWPFGSQGFSSLAGFRQNKNLDPQEK
jgi:hypothetical protein